MTLKVYHVYAPYIIKWNWRAASIKMKTQIENTTAVRQKETPDRQSDIRFSSQINGVI